MGVEIRQETNEPSPAASLVEDTKQARIAHLQANSRIKTTLIGKITQTSPGVISGLGGDTTMSLPGGAIPTDLRFFGQVGASTALATISVGIDTTSTYFLNAVTVSGAANGTGQFTPNGATNLYTQLALLSSGLAHAVTGFYTEAGTSGSGGPFYVEIDYYKPIPA